MDKIDVIERMNRDHIEKVMAFNRMSSRKQRRVPPSFWSEHDCMRYAWQGSCLDCGQALIPIDVPLPSLEQGLARDVACF